MRLDLALAHRGLADSKSKAKSLVESGVVCVNGAVITKPARTVSEADIIEITDDACPWVSRAGLKLAHAMEYFEIDVKDAIALDIGASTGGFTEVLLHHGAPAVYAVDVGTDQLHPRLRDDDRVISIEQTNARELTRDHIPDMVDIITCDASFISLEKVLPAPLALAAEKAQLIVLIKPQFEVGKDRLGKGGVVKDEALHEAVCEQVFEWVKGQGWQVHGITESPILGPKGNKEFLLYAHKGL